MPVFFTTLFMASSFFGQTGGGMPLSAVDTL